MGESLLVGLNVPNDYSILAWLLPLASNAIVAATIGLVAWLGSRLYRRPALWHTVWVLAMVKLFIPPIWSVPTTLFNKRLPVVATNVNSPIVRYDIAAVESTPSLDIFELAETPIERPEVGRWTLQNVSWGVGLMSLWGLGSLVAFSTSTYRIARFHALVRRSIEADSATDALVETTAASLCDTSTRPHVRLVDHTAPPLLWPVGRTPTIVLPLRWWETIAQTERSTVVMHELVHWRRCDHWIRLLQLIASIVFWWHPLVWIARGELYWLEEQCCDAEVIHRLPGAGRAYASALLSASQWLDDSSKSNKPHYSPSLLAMPMSHLTQFESFRRRIQMLTSLNHRPWTRRHMAAMCFAAVIPLTIGLSAHAAGDEAAARAAWEETDRNLASCEVIGTWTRKTHSFEMSGSIRVLNHKGQFFLKLQCTDSVGPSDSGKRFPKPGDKFILLDDGEWLSSNSIGSIAGERACLIRVQESSISNIVHATKFLPENFSSISAMVNPKAIRDSLGTVRRFEDGFQSISRDGDIYDRTMFFSDRSGFNMQSWELVHRESNSVHARVDVEWISRGDAWIPLTFRIRSRGRNGESDTMEIKFDHFLIDQPLQEKDYRMGALEPCDDATLADLRNPASPVLFKVRGASGDVSVAEVIGLQSKRD